MNKRLALTKDGKLTYCTASEENIGKGRCNHIAHQGTNETVGDFMTRANKNMSQHTNENYKQKLYTLNFDEKCEMIENHENLDVFVDDEDKDVRIAVAEQGYCLNKLVDDPSWQVREKVARQGYGLDKLVNDEDLSVRKGVVKNGYALDKLIDDEEWMVRVAVVWKGYGLNKLANDKNKHVRESVNNYLEENNMTLDEWKEKYPDRVVGK